MNPFGNRDEPRPPDWYLSERPQWWRLLCWFLRNPLHNFTHYQIGWAGQEYEIYHDEHADLNRDGFADNGGWYGARLKLGYATRPYVSYSGRVCFYIGWHPASGKFGFRLTGGL